MPDWLKDFLQDPAAVPLSQENGSEGLRKFTPKTHLDFFPPTPGNNYLNDKKYPIASVFRGDNGELPDKLEETEKTAYSENRTDKTDKTDVTIEPKLTSSLSEHTERSDKIDEFTNDVELPSWSELTKPTKLTKLTKPPRADHLAIVEAAMGARPEDVGDAHWDTALRGLRTFLAAGDADAAEAAGWTKDELYQVPELWSRVDLCGAALLIGDREVVNISSAEIKIRTPGGGTLGIYRRPPEPSIPVKPPSLDPPDAKSAEALRRERARINHWIAGQIINWPRNSCLHCRKPILPGQRLVVVASGDALAHFHEPCHPQWLIEQEIAARKAMGLPAIEHPATKETTTP